jgi:perosamine synthetase
MFRKIRCLIPRYNWDYGFRDMVFALLPMSSRCFDPVQAVSDALGQKPLTTTSGRVSLYLILKSLELAPEGGVGVPLFCCPVVFETIQQAGLAPVFMDIDDVDFCISTTTLQTKIRQIDAVIIVHMFGNVADTPSLNKLSESRPLIEDCAHSLYSKRNGLYTGFSGTCSFFSFRSGKYVSAGEGSAMYCNDPVVWERLKELTDQLPSWRRLGQALHAVMVFLKSLFYRRPLYGLVGYPLGRKMDKTFNLTAKEGLHLRKMAKSDAKIIVHRLAPYRDKIMRQRANSLYMLSRLRMRNAVLPHERVGCESNFYQFAVRFSSQKHRDAAADFLFSRGIDTAKYADGVPELARRHFGYHGDCPVAERCCRTTLVVPNHYTLSQEDIDYIADSLQEVDSHLDGIGQLNATSKNAGRGLDI